MEAFLKLVTYVPALVIKLMIVLPAVAVYYEDGWETVDRKEFACWLVGYLVAWFVIAQTFVFLRESTLAQHSLVVLALLSVFMLIPFGLVLYHFHQSVAQRARDAGWGKAVAYLAAIPPVNVVLFVFLLLRPSAPPSRTRRRPRWRKLWPSIWASLRRWT